MIVGPFLNDQARIPSHSDHSAVRTARKCPFHSSSTTFTTDSSFSPFRYFLQISQSISTSTPTVVTPSRAQIAKRLGWSNAHAGAGIVDSHPDNPQKYKDPFDVVEAAAKAELRKLLSEMDSLVDSPATTSDVKLMFYFDEASTLTRGKAPSNPDNKNLYDILCSCFNTFRTYPLFVIFLSTSSHIEALAPSGPLANSARA
ncbi:hypothetical protein JB92DRAFT_3116238 [Gautieria morchelliformis]|nr:hypothetical protein JB92DRAFT_3116238 [Gautieria morchelliformis]